MMNNFTYKKERARALSDWASINQEKPIKGARAEGSQHLLRYPCSSTLGSTWSMGFLLLVFLALQFLSGIALSTYYVADIDKAFFSVHTHIYRNVPNGWLFMYMHSNGATVLFALLYMHIIRGVYFRAFTRVGMWNSGMLLYLLMMASAFTGYVLPWGQMSYWALTVITNFFTAIPYVGDKITQWIWGGEAIGTGTLRRFFALHFILPICAIALSGVHVLHLHVDGTLASPSTSKQISILWFQSYLLKDLLAFNLCLMIFAYLVLKNPDLFNHPDNWVPADSTKTPPHIVPEWYFLPFYGIVKSIPHKEAGIGLMFIYILSPLLFPWLDKAGPGPDGAVRVFVTFFYVGILCVFILLGWIGLMPVNTFYSSVGAYLVAIHFALLILISIFSRSRYR